MIARTEFPSVVCTSRWAVPENLGAERTLHGALGVTRNVYCSPHVHHRHCTANTRRGPKVERFKGLLSVLVRYPVLEE